MNFTEHISEDLSDVEEDDGFLVQSIVFSSLGMALLVLFLFCNKKRVSSCFENYLVVNVAASDEEYAQRVVRQEMEKEMNRMESPEKRTARLRKNFEKNSVIMVLEMTAFFHQGNRRHIGDETTVASSTSIDESIEDGTSSRTHSIAEVKDGNVEIQLSKTSPNGSRRVPNCCAICLSSYELGDKIVWSINTSCQHAFHDTCIISWLVKNQKGTPCPCCRSDFTDLEPHDDYGGNGRGQNRFMAYIPFFRARA